jgi:hypothetical protein
MFIPRQTMCGNELILKISASRHMLASREDVSTVDGVRYIVLTSTAVHSFERKAALECSLATGGSFGSSVTGPGSRRLSGYSGTNRTLPEQGYTKQLH